MRNIILILYMAFICSCADSRSSEFAQPRLKSGKHLAQLIDDKYYRVFHVNDDQRYIEIVKLDGDKFRVVGGSEIENDGSYMAVYDVEFWPKRDKVGSPETPLWNLPGYALVMEEGKVTMQDCQVRINGLPTVMHEFIMAE